VSHVGKLYNVVARAIAEEVVAEVAGVRYAECYLVSCIGAPVDDPALSHVRLGTDGAPASTFARAVEGIVRGHLADLPNVWRRIMDGTVQLF
jgi:S-adenosylmethionine synthetase